jgi:hypothetical protein
MAAITNYYIDTGSNFCSIITVRGSDGLPLNLTGYTVTSYIRRSPTSKTHINFNPTIYSAIGGQVRLSLSHTDTDGIKPGRYMYDVEIQAPGENGERRRVSEGIIVFTPQITKPDPE